MASLGSLRAWPNRKDLVTKHFTLLPPCLVLFGQLKTFLLFSCLMGEVLCSFGQPYQTCLARAGVPHLLIRLYPRGVYVFVTHSSLLVEFDLSLIKHVLTVSPLTSTSACLGTKQCLMLFKSQTFLVCPGPKKRRRP